MVYVKEFFSLQEFTEKKHARTLKFMTFADAGKHIFVFVSSCEFDAVKDGGLTWGKTTSRNWTTQRFGGEKRDPGMYYRSL